MQTAIEFDNITKSYGEKQVLREMTLSIEKGKFVTIIGSSGSGKTTALEMINGLIELRRNIGYAIQGSVLFPHMTVEQNISYVPNLLNKKDKQKTAKAVSKWMDIVGLDEELKHRYPAELSGGQQQRVGIARALAASPDILLMDEPFGAVDAITREQLQNELLQIYKKTGITIVFVTHDIAEALKLGTKILVMDSEVIEQYDSPSEVIKNPATQFVKKLIEKEQR